MTFTEQVGLLLGQATHSVYRFGRDIVDPKAFVGTVGPNTYVARQGEVAVISEPALLLERLYAGVSFEDRASFVPALFRDLNEQNARVVARTLAATHNLAPLAETPDMRPGIEELWRGLIHTLRLESVLFSERDLQTVLAAAKRADGVARAFAVKRAKVSASPRPGWVYRQLPIDTAGGTRYHIRTPFQDLVPEAHSVVDRIRYLRLAKTIREGRNPAVDTDRQVLLSRLQARGFSDLLSTTLDEIEQRAAIAATPTDVKTVMDLLRSFYENFAREAYGKLETTVGKSVPSGSFQPYKQYLENAGLIVADESAILQSVYNFLSNQGAHKLTSAPEQLRVAHAVPHPVSWTHVCATRHGVARIARALRLACDTPASRGASTGCSVRRTQRRPRAPRRGFERPGRRRLAP